MLSCSWTEEAEAWYTEVEEEEWRPHGSLSIRNEGAASWEGKAVVTVVGPGATGFDSVSP